MLKKNLIRKSFLRIAGYLVPFFQSLPPLGVWTGTMTIPLISYLVILFSSFPTSLSTALEVFFTEGNYFIIEKICIIIGMFFLCYSSIYLIAKRKTGLVTSGPYRLVRHPQYLGIVLFTFGLTSWSYWLLTHTYGIGFLTSQQTVGVWIIELFAYVLLANIEELYLSKEYKESFENYRSKTPFLIPLLQTNRRSFDSLISILIPAILFSFPFVFLLFIGLFLCVSVCHCHR
jgi:protein-S-isoprenylcysteine O-methyltransferase Ste14